MAQRRQNLTTMHEPRYLVLHWIPGRESSLPYPPSAEIVIRSQGSSVLRDSDVKVLGAECRTKQEIDHLIDAIIEDVEFARRAAHERFEH